MSKKTKPVAKMPMKQSAMMMKEKEMSKMMKSGKMPKKNCK